MPKGIYLEGPPLMNPKLTSYPYTQSNTSIFENIFKSDNVLMNHVVVEPGQSFPKHPTDAEVYALVVKGVLSIAIEEESPENYEAGRVVYIPKGLLSELANKSEGIVELFVVKTNL